MTTETQLKQAFNEVHIEGTLFEKNLEVKTNDNGTYIVGDLQIQVAENEVHKVSIYASKLKKDGTENGLFKGFETVMEQYNAVAEVGLEQADRVRVNRGQIGLNDYVDGNGQLKSFPQISTNFINRLNASDPFEPKAKFEVEALVKSVIREQKNDEETGRVILNTYIPLFGGRIIPFEFVVSEEGADFVEENYEPGSTVNFFGDIVNFNEKKTTVTKAAFGADQEKTVTTTKREYLVTGGQNPYEEDSAKVIKVELAHKAMTEREAYLEELIAKKANANNQGATKKTSGFPTGNKKPATTKKPDLPF